MLGQNNIARGESSTRQCQALLDQLRAIHDDLLLSFWRNVGLLGSAVPFSALDRLSELLGHMVVVSIADLQPEWLSDVYGAALQAAHSDLSALSLDAVVNDIPGSQTQVR